jgi:hypothetical protein
MIDSIYHLYDVISNNFDYIVGFIIGKANMRNLQKLYYTIEMSKKVHSVFKTIYSTSKYVVNWVWTKATSFKAG